MTAPRSIRAGRWQVAEISFGSIRDVGWPSAGSCGGGLLPDAGHQRRGPVHGFVVEGEGQLAAGGLRA